MLLNPSILLSAKPAEVCFSLIIWFGTQQDRRIQQHARRCVSRSNRKYLGCCSGAWANKKEDQSIGQSLLSMGKVRSVSGVSFTLVSADQYTSCKGYFCYWNLHNLGTLCGLNNIRLHSALSVWITTISTSIFFSISQTLIGLSNKKEDQSIGQSLLSMGKVFAIGISITLEHYVALIISDYTVLYLYGSPQYAALIMTRPVFPRVTPDRVDIMSAAYCGDPYR
jgi:hypothetical protein